MIDEKDIERIKEIKGLVKKTSYEKSSLN